ncbi:MAG TPA: PstS family phosphate ABC transporter substrate-binding protein [Longimicrobiales bacterium]
MLMVSIAIGAAGCGERRGAGGGELSGSIRIDGSSTVFPLTAAVAEEFILAGGRGVRLTVGVSGTGGGFSRFCGGEIEIADASRPITETERAACARNGVEFLEVPVAYDGIVVVVNPQNTWTDCLTVQELRRIWRPASTVERWSDVRAAWPAEEIHLYGPGTDSGTFDYFTEAIVGEADASRPDFTASEDDNVLIQGVAGDPHALGYFGFAFYQENRGQLGLVAVDGGRGCVTPTPQTIQTGTYAPLSRPIFIYVDRAALERPEVRAFVRFYLENAATLAPAVGYVALDAAQYRRGLERVGEVGGAGA